MENSDFEIFRREISWFLKPTDKVQLTESKLEFSAAFVSTFPKLYKLVSQAGILDVSLARDNKVAAYKLLTWTDKYGSRSGWLCKFDEYESQIDLLPEHQLLVDNIGGIQESYTQREIDKEHLTDNQNFLFIKSECTKGIGGWDDYYEEMCKEYGCSPIYFNDFISFVQEANGDVTLYDPKTKEIMLFSHDHSHENVEIIKGQPEFTFYKIDGVGQFVDYVEMLADQWLGDVLGNN